MENLLTLQDVLERKNNYNLAIPFIESRQINPFYKLNVVQIYADISETADHIFKVGSKRVGEKKFEDLYSLKKPFLQKLATEAGIQFAPGSGDVIKVDENTWKASAFGALKLPDGIVRTSSNFKVIDLVTEEKKYRISYEEKAEKGIIDYKTAKDVSEKYAGQWIDTGKKNENGYPVRKYVVAEGERRKYIEKSLLDAMTQLRANAPQKAVTGAILRVIRDLLGIKGVYTIDELKKPFAVARVAFSPDYSDPVIKQMMLQQAMQSVGNIFGNTSPVIQTISIPETANVEDEVDALADVTQELSEEENLQNKDIANSCPADNEVREEDFYCDKCGCSIDERVWDYSYGNFGQPLCVNCQKKVYGENTEYTCHHCGEEIKENVYKYSVERFGEPLCMKCQKGARRCE